MHGVSGNRLRQMGIDMALSNDELAARLLIQLTREQIHKAEMYDYICWLEESEQKERLPGETLLVMASDGTTCWGKTIEDCYLQAYAHDKELFKAWQEHAPTSDEIQ